MARKKAPEKPANHERWLVSYGDFITLLFAVFVTLYAMSQTDKKKVNEVAASYRSAFGVSSSSGAGSSSIMKGSDMKVVPISEVLSMPTSKSKQTAGPHENRSQQPHVNIKELQDIKTMIAVLLKPLQAEGIVNVAESSSGLVIRLKEEDFFEEGSTVVKAGAIPVLGKIARAISSYSYQIRIEGHTDNLPVATDISAKSNWEFSTERAVNILQIFLNFFNLAPEKISIAGYGQFHPIADNSTNEGRSKNRRVDIVLLGVKSEMILP
jgi:chemotaxis protein MotB